MESWPTDNENCFQTAPNAISRIPLRTPIVWADRPKRGTSIDGMKKPNIKAKAIKINPCLIELLFI